MNAADSMTPGYCLRQRLCAAFVVALDTVLLMIQGGTGGAVAEPVRPRVIEEASDLLNMRHQGNAYFSSGQYFHAIELYQSGYSEAIRRGNPHSALRFMNNLGSAWYRVFRYREAIDAYLKARDLARSIQDEDSLAGLYVNLSSLYLQIGDLEDALKYSEQALRLPAAAVSKYKPQLLVQSAKVKEGQAKFEESADLLRQAVTASQDQLDMATEGQAWNELGDVLVKLGSLGPAERALLEAFRLRAWTSRKQLYAVYESLGNLRAFEGDRQDALIWFDRAVNSARPAGSSALWEIYYERGKIKRKNGQLADAFHDFSAALDGARRTRNQVPPADEFRVSAEAYLEDLYSAYIEAGIKLYSQTRKPRYAAQAFTAAEEHRSATLRSLQGDRSVGGTNSSEYQQALVDLHRAESGWVQGFGTSDVQSTHLKLAELEVQTHLNSPGESSESAPDLLARTRQSLRSSEVFLGFHVGDGESWLWAVTRRRLEFARLPPRKELRQTVSAFVKALREGSPQMVSSGRKLYSQLLGGVPRRFLDKPNWIIAADGPLFELPFAALPETVQESTPSYVIEHHAIRLTAGVSTLRDGVGVRLNDRVVGLGDPIYNRADPRVSQFGDSRTVADPGFSLQLLELARLAGSSRELHSYANIWRSGGYQPILLEGRDATRGNLLAALHTNPAIVHVAAHLVFPPDSSSTGLLALALEPNSGIELLSATEVAAWRLKVGLIVINGCSSGRASAIPGSGLMGMARAWLAAGSRAVVLTRWPIGDQAEGHLLHSFYERLMDVQTRSRLSFGELLQQAQLAEIRAGGERANPANWAAYFCVEGN
jgi:CHAT domain-containing protein/tetratricopeptide (TPR) repeat protein